MTLLQLVSPVDGSIYHERQGAQSAEMRAMMVLATAAAKSWARVPIAERIAQIGLGVENLQSDMATAATELAWQMGRPIRYAAAEITTAVARARHLLTLAEAAVKDQSVAPNRVISRDPIGVVMVIAPWNYPYLTAINSIVPALAAGNCVVLKHSFQTALVADRMVAAFVAAGVPEDVFQGLHCDNATTVEAVCQPEVGHVVFTGSVEVGRLIAIEAARHLKSVTLELGGKDPAYVRADADLDAAVAGLADGAFFNSGQSCCAIERIYVDRACYSQFVEGLACEAQRLVLGSPLVEETTLGPMARATGAYVVRAQIADAIAAGATALLGRRNNSANISSGNYVLPEILVDVSHDMAVMRDESFGPVVGVMPVDGDDEAIARMNDSRFGLTASIWSEDSEQVSNLTNKLVAGTIYQNRCDYLDPALPWSGRGESGLGLSLSHLAYDSLTRTKSRLIATLSPPSPKQSGIALSQSSEVISIL